MFVIYRIALQNTFRLAKSIRVLGFKSIHILVVILHNKTVFMKKKNVPTSCPMSPTNCFKNLTSLLLNKYISSELKTLLSTQYLFY